MSERILTLLTRAECGLCGEMRDELARLAQSHTLPPLRLIDLDTEAAPELKRRYTLKVPVLLLDEVPLCSGRLDPRELLRALERARPIPGSTGL